MALIECPECGWEVSDTAARCPKCAYSLGAGTPPIPPPAVKRGSKREWMMPALSVVAKLGVGSFLFGLGIAEDEYTGVMGGLIVGGSAIPTFIRSLKARLKPPRSDAALADGITDRILDMEHTHREQMADLEERIEFTERLLAKQREQIGPG